MNAILRLFKCTRTNKDGSVIVDAACCLPVFIIALGMLLMLIAQCGAEESVFRFCCVSIEAYNSAAVYDISDAEAYAAFAGTLSICTVSEWGSDQLVLVTGLTKDNRFAFSEGGLCIDGIVEAEVLQHSRIKIPKAFSSAPYTKRNFTFRPWQGESESFVNKDNSRVFIFPKRGERYHIEGCSSLKEGVVETVLTAKLRKAYASCQLCKPGTLNDGSIVYMFSGSSKVYHRKKCASITKYYECISKSEAKALGYTPCMLCCASIEDSRAD